MARRSSAKKAAGPAPAEVTEPAGGVPEPAGTAEQPEAQAADAGPAEDADPEEPVFANRAERRAHARGKGSRQQQTSGKIQAHGQRGPVQTPRSWANRRSG